MFFVSIGTGIAPFVPSEPTSRLVDPRDRGGVLADLSTPASPGSSRPELAGAVEASDARFACWLALIALHAPWLDVADLVQDPDFGGEPYFLSSDSGAESALCGATASSAGGATTAASSETASSPGGGSRPDSTPLTNCRRSNSNRVRAESQSGS